MISPKVMIQVQSLLSSLISPVTGAFAYENPLFVSLNLGDRTFYYYSLMEFRALKGGDSLDFGGAEAKHGAEYVCALIGHSNTGIKKEKRKMKSTVKVPLKQRMSNDHAFQPPWKSRIFDKPFFHPPYFFSLFLLLFHILLPFLFFFILHLCLLSPLT